MNQPSFVQLKMQLCNYVKYWIETSSDDDVISISCIDNYIWYDWMTTFTLSKILSLPHVKYVRLSEYQDFTNSGATKE